MKIKDMIQKLSILDPEKEIMVLDGFNGGGVPREINLGPIDQIISKKDVDLCGDCEIIGAGKEVIVIGYGFY